MQDYCIFWGKVSRQGSTNKRSPLLCALFEELGQWVFVRITVFVISDFTTVRTCSKSDLNFNQRSSDWSWLEVFETGKKQSSESPYITLNPNEIYWILIFASCSSLFIISSSLLVPFWCPCHEVVQKFCSGTNSWWPWSWWSKAQRKARFLRLCYQELIAMQCHDDNSYEHLFDC